MRYSYLCILFFVLAYLLPAAGRPMLRPDEYRYAEIPYEMIESGDFVVPRLLKARYFEKPVLGYWLVAVSFKCFGYSRFTLRLPMALASGAVALLLALWVRREKRDSELAALAALLYLASGLAVALGISAVLDGILCLFTTATIISCRMAVLTKRWDFERTLWLVLCGVSAGLGFLTKGLIAWAIPGTALLVWLLWEKRFKALLWLPWIPLAALVVTVLPWALAIHRADADFWNYFIVVEHFQRFRDHADTQHAEPFWFYIPVLLGTIFPAALAALPACGGGKAVWKTVWRDPLWRFALAAFLPPLVFLSASSGKLATYILPCFPFVALLMAIPTLRALRGNPRALSILKWVVTLLGWLLLVGGAGSVAFGAGLLPPVRLYRLLPELEGAWPFFIVIGIAGIADGILLIRARRRQAKSQMKCFFSAVAVALAPIALLPDFGSSKMPERDLRELVAAGDFDPRTAHIFTYGQMGHSVAFLLKRPDTRLVTSSGEMKYGAERARKEKEPPLLWTSREFSALLKRSDRPDVVYITIFDRDIPPYITAFPHRRLRRRELDLLVFPPAPARPKR